MSTAGCLGARIGSARVLVLMAAARMKPPADESVQLVLASFEVPARASHERVLDMSYALVARAAKALKPTGSFCVHVPRRDAAWMRFDRRRPDHSILVHRAIFAGVARAANTNWRIYWDIRLSVLPILPFDGAVGLEELDHGPRFCVVERRFAALVARHHPRPFGDQDFRRTHVVRLGGEMQRRSFLGIHP